MEEEMLLKLEEALRLAEDKNDVNCIIVLSALIGSKTVNDDGILASEVQKIVEDVLSPMAAVRNDGYTFGAN